MDRVVSRGRRLPCLPGTVACIDSHERFQEDESINDEKLKLTRGWNKVFPHSNEVDHEKVIFHNCYGITSAADLYRPKGAGGPFTAITVSDPFGAVKEQSSSLCAQTMTGRGFPTLAFGSSYIGESGDIPRYVAPPDISTEDFSAAVDHLNCHEGVDPERIGIIGIYDWGGMAINAATLDPQIKAAVASTMYDMSRITAKGYFGEQDSAAAYGSARARFATQHTADCHSGFYTWADGVVDPLPEDVPASVRDCHGYYKTPRDYRLCSLNSNGGWNIVGTASFPNQPLFAYAGEIRTSVLVVHGEKAHSRHTGEGAFAQLTGENKELPIVPGASHTNLYDGGSRDVIPFSKITEFFRTSLA